MRNLEDLDLKEESKKFFKIHGCKSVDDLIQCFAMFGMDLPEDVFNDVIDLMRESERP